MSLIALKRSMSNISTTSGRAWRWRPDQLAVEELRQVALVVDLGQAVEDREPVDLLVVLGLDVAAGQEAVDAVADAQVVAVLEQPGSVELLVVDERAVGALQVADVVASSVRLDAGVAARDGVVVDADVAVVAAAEHERPRRRGGSGSPCSGRSGRCGPGTPPERRRKSRLGDVIQVSVTLSAMYPTTLATRAEDPAGGERETVTHGRGGGNRPSAPDRRIPQFSWWQQNPARRIETGPEYYCRGIPAGATIPLTLARGLTRSTRIGSRVTTVFSLPAESRAVTFK